MPQFLLLFHHKCNSLKHHVIVCMKTLFETDSQSSQEPGLTPKHLYTKIGFPGWNPWSYLNF